MKQASDIFIGTVRPRRRHHWSMVGSDCGSCRLADVSAIVERNGQLERHAMVRRFDRDGRRGHRSVCGRRDRRQPN